MSTLRTRTLLATELAPLPEAIGQYGHLIDRDYRIVTEGLESHIQGHSEPFNAWFAASYPDLVTVYKL